MPVPKRKRSRARRDSRHANKGIHAKSFGKCKNCQETVLPHQVCKNCGHYKGAKVLTTKVERTIKRVETRKAQQTRKASGSQEPSSESAE